MKALAITVSILAASLAEAGEVIFAPNSETCAPYIGNLVRSCPDIEHTLALAPATPSDDALLAAFPQRHLLRMRFRCAATPAAPTVKVTAPWGSADLTGTSAGTELTLEGLVPHTGGTMTLTADIPSQTAFGPNCKLEVTASATLPLVEILRTHLARRDKELAEAAAQVARFAEVVPTGGGAEIIAAMRQQLEAGAAAKAAEIEDVLQGTSPLIPYPASHIESELAIATQAALLDELSFDQARFEGLSRRLGEIPIDDPRFAEFVRADLMARHAAARARVIATIDLLEGEAARLDATQHALAVELRALAASVGEVLP